MGLSASQARLLTLTSRLSDIEYKQQALSNKKMRFDVESEEISNKYTAALSKQKFQFKNDDNKYVDMTLKALLADTSKYDLIHVRSGKKVVTNSDHGTSSTNSTQEQPQYYHSVYADRYKMGVMPKFEEKVLKLNYVSADFPKKVKEKAGEFNFAGLSLNLPKSRIALRFDSNNFSDKRGDLSIDGKYTIDELNKLMVNKGQSGENVQPIWDTKSRTFLVPNDFHGGVCHPGFEYDTEKYNRISSDLAKEGQLISGGSSGGQGISYEEFEIDNKYLSDANWLYEAIESGEFKLVAKDGSDINTTSDTNIDSVRDDSDEVKAKAEYDAAMNKINRKEKMIDNEMKSLDTEYSAVKTEYESVNSIISNHTQKDFQLFG